MNTEDQDTASSRDGLPCESAPVLQENLKETKGIIPLAADNVDRGFVWIYFFLGYFFIYAFTSEKMNRNFSVFAAVYAAVVLVYVFAKGKRPGKEGWFWGLVVLGIGLPYAFWSVMQPLQVLMFIVTAAYWTLAVTGSLLEKGGTSQWVVFDLWNAMAVVPFCNFICHARILLGFARGSQEGEQKQRKDRGILRVGLGLVIALPVLVIIIPLLSNADAGFQKLMMNSGLYMQEHFFLTFARIILSLPVTAYLFGLVFGGIHRRDTDRIKKPEILKMGESVRVIPDAAMGTALIAVCLVYLLFIGLQGKYLFSAFAGIRPEGFTYAEYARRGFFELCQTAALNLFVLLGANLFSATHRDKNRVLRWLNVLLSVLTLLLITTAMSKMGMYIAAYGLTVKRILTMVFMIWMALVFVLVIVRQWKTFSLTKICVMAGAVLFALLCILPVEGMISAYNVWRFPV